MANASQPDLFPLTMDLRYKSAFANRIRRTVEMIGMEPFSVWTARPEDVIIGKLMAWEEGRSERYTADIFEMMLFYYLGGYEEIMLNETRVDEQARDLGEDVAAVWALLKESAREEASRR